MSVRKPKKDQVGPNGCCGRSTVKRHTCRKRSKESVHTSTLGHRCLQDSEHAAKTSGGHKSMHATKLPPGQSPGVGVGVGVGAGGVGLGVGLGVGEASVVEPIGPNLMSEKITCESACADSTSSGLPESAEQYPRRVPGSVEPTG